MCLVIVLSEAELTVILQIFTNADKSWFIYYVYRGDLAVGPRLFESTDCMLHFDGTVACLPIVEMEALCVPDITYWPYDTQTCKLKIGSWVHRGDEIDIYPIQDGLVIPSTFTQNAEWQLMNTSYRQDPGLFFGANSSFPSVIYTFLIKRHSGAATATIILPALGK